MKDVLDVLCISDTLVSAMYQGGTKSEAIYLELPWVALKIFNCPSTHPEYNSACFRITSYKIENHSVSPLQCTMQVT